MKRSRSLTAACGLVALSGCTSLHTEGGMPAEFHAERPLQAGLPYYLPAAKVTPAAVIRLAACRVDASADKALLSREGGLHPLADATFAAAGDITVEQVKGPRVLIDYRKLGGFLKTTDIALERQPNGMLKSINASLEDETPGVIADVAVVAGTIALATVAPPALAALPAIAMEGASPGKSNLHDFAAKASPPVPVSFAACTAETVQARADRADLSERRDRATARLEEETAALSKLLGYTDPGLSPAAIDQIHHHRDAIAQLTTTLADLAQQVAAIDGKLSLPLRPAAPITLPANGNALSEAKWPLSVDEPALQSFIATHFTIGEGRTLPQNTSKFRHMSEKKDLIQAMLDKLKDKKQALLTARLVAPVQDGGAPALPPAKGASLVSPADGILYVEPATVDFTLAQGDNTLKEITASIPQLGTYLVLPLRAGFGEKVSLSATFNADGSLATAHYGRPSSAGKALSSTLAGLGTQYLATVDAMRARKLSLLKAQADQLAAQKDVADKQNALAGDPLKDINAQIAVVNAQATLAEANLRLAAANAKLGQ